VRRPRASMDSFAALVSVVEYGQLTKAAEQLGLTVSALHKRLQALSMQLGTQLVHISRDRLSLTEAGELFYAEAAQTLEHATLAEEKMRAHLLLRAKRLVIGHSTYLAPRLLATIHRLSEESAGSTHLEHHSGLSMDIVERVANGGLHAGFVFLPVRREGLMIRQVFEEPLVACIPSSWPLASRTEIHAEDIAGQSFVSVGREVIPTYQAEIEDYFAGFGIRLRVVEDAFAPAEALVYVAQAVGMCILARSSAIADRGVTIRPLATRALTRRSGLILREDNRDLQISQFMDIVLKRTARMAHLLS
jgi:DNA-binding transcriptional LysR family regulator